MNPFRTGAVVLLVLVATAAGANLNREAHAENSDLSRKRPTRALQDLPTREEMSEILAKAAGADVIITEKQAFAFLYTFGSAARKKMLSMPVTVEMIRERSKAAEKEGIVLYSADAFWRILSDGAEQPDGHTFIYLGLGGLLLACVATYVQRGKRRPV